VPIKRTKTSRFNSNHNHSGPQNAWRWTKGCGRYSPSEDYKKENLKLLEKGVENMVHHINTIRKSGINPVCCINRFHTDTDAEVAM